ncbi:low specificity L-threonine aldolase [Sinorhizobium sp. BG8]|uniref:threonine aldolase family protein n=1 Tax=Sinorhizobium sp. BG8 TaxID=2613773 RepID=UPI00193E07A6|nr:low specificity L-threonine aldolase [Sinorhizobium sp. BG8]QRM56670.1 low specificity L-threonine aldolase [Sinorhizobium sp. BG8]
MHFASDNWAGAHPRIAQSLTDAAGGFAAAYGTSDLDKAVERTFSEIFEHDVAVFFVATGTAANSLALASFNRPGGQIFCHHEAHVNVDECNAPEFFATGAKLTTVQGIDGKMDPHALAAAIARFPPDFVHGGQPMAVTMTQATEAGTVYTLDEIAAIGAVAHDVKLPLHMDGARFANALATLGTTPAEMTWKRGVDILSFGGTKNGCWCAEALVLFDTAKAREMHYLRKRSAQLFSKSRFIAAQFEAYFRDGLWLELAGHSNEMASRLAKGIAAAASARLAWQTGSNEVFAIVRNERIKALHAKGAVFYDWHPPEHVKRTMAEDETMIRLVTSFATRPEDVDAFLATL